MNLPRPDGTSIPRALLATAAVLILAGIVFALIGAIGVYIFILALVFSIGLHEFGHFISAKKFGIKVHKFYVGFPPRVWSIQRGETEYGIGAVPFGGFVKIAGMSPYEDVPPEDRDRVFKAKAPWKRAIVLAAGSFTHFVLALIILTAVLAAYGRPDLSRPTREVASVQPGSAAADAGLQQGDEVVAIDGRALDSWQQLVGEVSRRPGEKVTLTVRRDEDLRRLRATLGSERPDGTAGGFLGIGPVYATQEYSIPAAIGQSVTDVGRGIVASLDGLRTIFSPSTFGRLFQQMIGAEERQITDPATVVGIGAQAGGLASRGDFATLFLLIAGLNIFIGVANLLPLPPLDGGHLAVLAYEKVARRDVDMQKLMPVTAAVIAVFGSLFLLLLVLDITQPLPPIPG